MRGGRMSDNDVRPPSPKKLARRDLMKLGAGVVAGAVTATDALAQRGGRGGGRAAGRGPAPPVGSGRPPDELRPHTGPGYYVNDYDRLDGNGPMDDATRRIVEFAQKYNYSDMTPTTRTMVNRTMVDS